MQTGEVPFCALCFPLSDALMSIGLPWPNGLGVLAIANTQVGEEWSLVLPVSQPPRLGTLLTSPPSYMGSVTPAEDLVLNIQRSIINICWQI